MLIPYSTVSKVLRRKDQHLARDVSPEPPRFDRRQSKASNQIEEGLRNLDESAPWSSWSKITAAGRNAMMIPDPPTSSRKPMQANQTSKVEHNLCFMQMGSALMRDVSQMPVLPVFNPSQESSPTLEKDFWTGRRQSHRSSSVQSYGSSRNSSLHGSRENDRSYQSPVFSDQFSEEGKSPRRLVPAPIDWKTMQSNNRAGKEFSFDCEICGETVKASRRLMWQ